MRVSILDAAGQVVTTDDSPVTLSVADSPTPTVTVSAVNGVATFPNIVIDQAGSESLNVTDGVRSGGASLIVYQPFWLVARFGHARFPTAMTAASAVNTTVPLTLINTGPTTSFYEVQVDLFADAGTTLDANAIPLGSDYLFSFALPARGTLALSLPIHPLPATLVPGTYHLIARVTETDQVASVATSVQTMTLASAFIQPTLSVGGVSPATLVAGQFASVSVTVTNAGNVAARGVDLALSPSSDGVTPIPGLTLTRLQSNVQIAPNHSKTLRLRFQVPGNVPPGANFPFVSCLLAGVTAAAAGPMQFTIAGSAAPTQ